MRRRRRSRTTTTTRTRTRTRMRMRTDGDEDGDGDGGWGPGRWDLWRMRMRMRMRMGVWEDGWQERSEIAGWTCCFLSVGRMVQRFYPQAMSPAASDNHFGPDRAIEGGEART
ncbi:hypothetical protein AOL_s00083g477 [Orbilia oligospora ATCC 24927]|uniref:Uncharacterized protein n=1 Tax=Arthrobotrys oligospora (strain ATCC 24927 / CBS 115.81 / DSM 1491) TaxID=756982 RepID=G1XHJ6_ARTOA|nr:hypothetical protein AOL_s00083g477 [Orbilia oligospora ATCC 24927]EGX47384.1 hypothetical protein AOL_s00083g477 [Orbilia oligospora ATCC 24927]